jgi:hypothetical protein
MTFGPRASRPELDIAPAFQAIVTAATLSAFALAIARFDIATPIINYAGMAAPTRISPPTFVKRKSGMTFALSSVEDVTDYIKRHDTDGAEWDALRSVAFVAAAVPSDENIEGLRALAIEAFGAGRF